MYARVYERVYARVVRVSPYLSQRLCAKDEIYCVLPGSKSAVRDSGHLEEVSG